MKPVQVDTKGKFFRFIRYVSGKTERYYLHYDRDLCWFIRHILITLFIVGLFKLAAIGIVIAGVISFISILGAPLVHHLLGITGRELFLHLAPLYLVSGIICIISILAVVALIGHTCYRINQWWQSRDKQEKQREPGLIVHAYESWKGKYCMKIKFK